MCLIIHKPAGVTVPGDLIRTAWEDKPDGAGIMYPHSDGLKVYKVMPGDWADPADHVDKVMSELADVEAGIHFRWRTHGPVSRENAHPYVIPGSGGYVMHNGVLNDALLGPGYKMVQDTLSDTAFYTITTLTGAPGADDVSFWEIVGADVGSYNKMLVMDAQGRFLRINDKAWADYKGLRLSNELSCPEYCVTRSNWKDYYAAGYARSSATSTYDRSDADTSKFGGTVVIHTGPSTSPGKLSRRERKILNACLRSNSWGPLRQLNK
jgi:predicted glutamine amidotransferase